MKKRTSLALLGLLSLIPFQALLANELPLPTQPHLVIEGRGVVEEIPDMVNIGFEVSATAKTLADAKRLVDKRVGKAITASLAQGIDADDINASKIQAAPQYEWRNQQRVYTGERISRQVTVKLKDTGRYNDLVDGLLTAGINRLHTAQLMFSQQPALEAKALTLALDNARRQATIISQHLDTPLAGIFQIAPVGSQVRVPHLAMRADAESKSDNQALKLGKQKIEQRVRVVFLLAN